VQVLLVHPAEGTQVGAKRCPRSCAGVAVDLADASVIIITCPLPSAVTHRGRGRMAAAIALPLVCVQDCSVCRDVLGDQVVARACVRVVADPEAWLARLSRDHTEDRGTSVRIRSVPFTLIGASPWRVGGVAMGPAVFPPRADTVRRPHGRCQSSRRWALCRSDWPGCAAAGYAAASVTPPTRAPAGPSARPWRSHAAAAGACEPIRMQVALQPDQADAIIQEFADRKVNHTPMIPRSARCLHMSQAQTVALETDLYLHAVLCNEAANRLSFASNAVIQLPSSPP
jgi:hypothetical protein